MTNNLAQQEKGVYEYETHSGEKLKLSKKTVQDYIVGENAKITDSEFMFFVQLCKVNKLNPFLKEAYLVKYGTAPAQILTDYKVLQQIANRSGVWGGIKQGVIVLTESGELVERKGQVQLPTDKLIGAWAEVYRKDIDVPFYVSVNFDEFVGKKKSGEVNGQWATKPSFMIEKVAKAHALRVAFPEEMQGIYIQEEMDHTQNQETRRVVDDEIIVQDEVTPVLEEIGVDYEEQTDDFVKTDNVASEIQVSLDEI